ncbi:MAG: putative acyl-CoA synthetase [Actinomycetia bacterium]|nr:putative acyl-CoA synthetase [Actinomycetes bacterium]
MTAPGEATTTLSEVESKRLLARYGVPVLDERTAATADDAVAAAAAIGFPVVLKLCGASIAHKTERGLVRLNVRDAEAVRDAAQELLEAATPEDGDTEVLVAPMVRGNRELIAGLVRDPQFGPCVMLGVGGILAEAVADVAFRVVPLTNADADELAGDLRTQALLGPFRGEPAIDRVALRSVLRGLSDLAVAEPNVASVDVNPLIVVNGKPVAVDALVEQTVPTRTATAAAPRARPSDAAFQALFDPRGVVVAGASSHPGKFGFVALHNVLAHGYAGAVGATNLEGTSVLGVATVRSIDELPDGPWDLVFVCTPAGANVELLRACARRGIRAAFLTSAGYGEAGDAGKRAESDLVALCDELGILLAGPNGQGVVSTPSSLCAQIVAPYPPRGRIAVASQSGNFVSSFLNWSRQTGVGVSRAVSAGNAAAVSVADYLDFYAADDASAVSLAYVEGISDGRAFFERLREVTQRKPVVLVKGGATAGGQRAAASHTGSLASDDRVFDGLCNQVGATRTATVEEAFEAAATFATQPLPRGPRTVVVTTAGGWGVVTADAITRSELELVALPDDLKAQIDEKLPPRWSRNNPIDLAGGETRDTIPEVLELVARHPDVDAIVYLGLGIQSNQARLMREGRFYPDHGLERIVSYHERQDERFARAAAAISDATGKPILTATELAVAAPDNPGPATVRETGRLCYASANRAVTALEHLWRYARHRQRREG